MSWLYPLSQPGNPSLGTNPAFGMWADLHTDPCATLAQTRETHWSGRQDQMPRRNHLKPDEVVRLLGMHKAELAKRFGVTDLALFGSVARDTASPESDIDILVAFDGPATSRQFFGVQFYLEDLLGTAVDLVTDKALRPELRPHVEREAIHV